MKKIWIIIGIIIVIALAIGFIVTQTKKEPIVTQTKKEPEEIKIGVILPLTGPAAKYGIWTKEGMEIALEEVRQSYPKYNFRIIFEDDGGKPEQAVNSMNKLIKIDKVPVVTGAIQSQTALAIAPIAEKEKIVLLSTGASAEKLKDAGDYIFRIRESSKIHGERAALEALSISNRAGVIFLNAENGLSYAEDFKKNYEKNGGVIEVWDAYNEGENDFRSYLAKIKEKEIEVVYIPGLASEIALLLKQSKELGIKATFISSVGAENPKLLEIAKESAEGLIYTYPFFDPSIKDVNDKINEFVKKYEKKFGYEPEFLAANGYDAIKLLSQIIIERGYSADEIKSGLYEIKNFEGIGGNFHFDENGEVIKPVIVKHVKNLKFEVKR